MAAQGKHILIAGGGIGGLTAALALADAGHEVQLFEQRADFAAAGAGIQLSPNCSRVLHRLGLARQLAEVACLPQTTEFRDWRSGRRICSAPLGELAGGNRQAPYYHIYRPDLLHILLSAAGRRKGIRLTASAPVVGFTERETEVALRLASGAEVAGDLLLGADGIHSRVRELLWGRASPRFTGMVAFRALVPAAQLPAAFSLPRACVWWGPGRHLVHYPVRAGAWVNCVCVVEQSGWELESWVEPGDPLELQPAFSGWHDDIQRLLAGMEPGSLFKWALFDRPPLRAWSSARATLLGDACHPTLPFLAQGAALAVEDAAVLANCLGAPGPVSRQLRRYQTLRRRRTADIQLASRRGGAWFHLRGAAALLRNLVAGPLQRRMMRGIYAYDPLKPV